MEKLTRALLNSGFEWRPGLEVGTKMALPEQVMQFGEGNFLRAFVDYMIDVINGEGYYDGGIVVVQPIAQGMVSMLNDQDGLYTLFARGLEDGKPVVQKRLVTSITRGVNPYAEYETYLECVKNPDLRFVVSNTTEAGIVFDPEARLEDKPQNSFPGKVTALLYERFRTFGGAKDKGLVFIPCELIDYNGTTLRDIVLRHAQQWGLGEDFITFVKEANVFTNTLVDRIVTGYPRDEAAQLCAELGYRDDLLDTSEIFHFWVIEGPPSLSSELPFDKAGLSVVWTGDATPYKMRKVRILNGAHTMSVLGAYLAGHDTVLEMLEDGDFGAYLRRGLFDEVIPTLDLDYDDLKSFAEAVFDRFANPHIKHYLLSIALNSVSKYKARVLPSVLEYQKRKGESPKLLAYSFAALCAFYRGDEIRDGALIGRRGAGAWGANRTLGTGGGVGGGEAGHGGKDGNDGNVGKDGKETLGAGGAAAAGKTGGEYRIQDDGAVLEYFRDAYEGFDGSEEAAYALVRKVAANQAFWGVDLNTIGDFTRRSGAIFHDIITIGAKEALRGVLV
ncbi:MAG: tagaturonate reductase [Lachnospiraceae bacterium]|jgi:tagaturonate reductase|nr:tagaturonate reductase [Lachnospiraceae bacterium]